MKEHITPTAIPVNLHVLPDTPHSIAPHALQSLTEEIARACSSGNIPGSGDSIYLGRTNLHLTVLRRHWQLADGHSEVTLYVAQAIQKNS